MHLAAQEGDKRLGKAVGVGAAVEGRRPVLQQDILNGHGWSFLTVGDVLFPLLADILLYLPAINVAPDELFFILKR